MESRYPRESRIVSFKEIKEMKDKKENKAEDSDTDESIIERILEEKPPPNNPFLEESRTPVERKTAELPVYTYSGTTAQISMGTTMSAQLPDALQVPVTIGPIVSLYDRSQVQNQRQIQPVQLVNQEPPRNVETTVVTEPPKRRVSNMMRVTRYVPEPVETSTPIPATADSSRGQIGERPEGSRTLIDLCNDLRAWVMPEGDTGERMQEKRREEQERESDRSGPSGTMDRRKCEEQNRQLVMQ